jgi:hypothetical protein
MVQCIKIIAMMVASVVLLQAEDVSVKIKAVNGLQLERKDQTIELSSNDLAALKEKDLGKIHVRDEAGKELLCQAVDMDGDYTADRVIFQADFAAGETKYFIASVGAKWIYSKDQFKAYGRFVRERFDDFTWENDRIAHRMYGKALETWVREPLTSSTVDIWSKREPKMVLNDWYMMDNYHADNGEGADFYSAGRSRGCGGNGLWAENKLWVSKNFINSRVLANGPIRVLFELTYEPFDVNGTTITEIKRISLDAGQNLDHYQSSYRIQSGSAALVSAAGLKKVAGEQKEFNAEHGWLAKWEKMEKNAGNQGLAIVADPKSIILETEDSLNRLMILQTNKEGVASYWAGFTWDKNSTTYDSWKSYVDNFAQGLISPIQISVVSFFKSVN